MREEVCYLLHFDQKIAHAQHYLGKTVNLDRRLREHASGVGARLPAVAKSRGIGFVLVRTWKPEGDETLSQLERRLKRMKCSPQLCNVCRDATDT